MFKNLRLAVRLVRGGGLRDWLRITFMAVGIACGVIALLIGLAVPRAISNQTSKNDARMPVWNEAQVSVTMDLATQVRSLGTASWTLATVYGGDESSPIPPGLARLPDVGHSIVSPALARLIDAKPETFDELGEVDGSNISQAGLASPDELLSYTRSADVPADSSMTIVAFGGHSMSGDGGLGLGAEAAILILVPALIFLIVCAQLSIGSRSKRLASLRMLGVSQRRCAKIFGVEMGIVAIIGGIFGVAIYDAMLPWLSNGLLGLKWFGDESIIGPWLGGFIVLFFTVLTVLLSRQRMHKVLAGMKSESHRDPSPVRMWIGGTLLVTAFVFLLTIMTRIVSAKPDALVVSPSIVAPATYLVLILSISGVLLVLPGATRSLSGLVSKSALPISIRLGARFAGEHFRTGGRLVTVLAMTILSVGASGAFLYGMYLDGVGDPTTTSISIDLEDVPESQREPLRELIPEDSFSLVPATNPVESGVPSLIHIEDCESYLRGLGASVTSGCPSGPFRAGLEGQYGTLPAGAAVTVETSNGPLLITVPEQSVPVASAFDIVIPKEDAPWLFQAKAGTIFVTIPKSDFSDQKFLQALNDNVPNAKPLVQTKDQTAIDRYVEQSAVLRAALVLAFILTLGAFALTLVDARWTGRSVLAAQNAIGVPRRVMMFSAAVQFAFPVALAALVIVPIAGMSAAMFLSLWGAKQSFNSGAFGSTMSLAGIAIVIAAGAGAITSWRKVSIDELNNE